MKRQRFLFCAGMIAVALGFCGGLANSMPIFIFGSASAILCSCVLIYESMAKS